MLAIPALLGETQRGDPVELSHRLLRRAELRLRLVDGDGPPPTAGLPDEEPEHEQNDEGQSGLDHDRGKLGRGAGQTELRLQRLDVVRVLARLDDARHHDGNLRGRRDTGHAPGSLKRHVDRGEDQITDTERGDPIAEGVAGVPVGAPRDLRRLRVEDLELPHHPAHAVVGDLVTRVGLDDQGELDGIADRDPALVERGRRRHRAVSQSDRTDRERRERHEGEDTHQFRLERALNSARRAGTYGRSVERSTRSIPIRLNVRRR